MGSSKGNLNFRTNSFNLNVPGIKSLRLMWECLLSMYCFYCLMNKEAFLALACDRVEQSWGRGGRTTKLNAGRKKAESKRSHVALPETDAGQNLANKPQPCGNTQTNEDGLI